MKLEKSHNRNNDKGWSSQPEEAEEKKNCPEKWSMHSFTHPGRVVYEYGWMVPSFVLINFFPRLLLFRVVFKEWDCSLQKKSGKEGPLLETVFIQSFGWILLRKIPKVEPFMMTWRRRRRKGRFHAGASFYYPQSPALSVFFWKQSNCKLENSPWRNFFLMWYHNETSKVGKTHHCKERKCNNKKTYIAEQKEKSNSDNFTRLSRLEWISFSEEEEKNHKTCSFLKLRHCRHWK